MRKALIVGIDDYNDSPLHGCINDASEMYSVLEKNEDNSPNFSTKREDNIPTKAKLKEAIVDLFSGSEEVALFYYSGHGYVNDINGYLVTPDASAYDEGVPMSEIMGIIKNSKVKNKIIILDCCYSGNLGNTTGTISPSSELVMGTTILTASSANECSLEINGHGVFTNLLIQALRGGAADLTGNITPGGIYAFIDQALGAWYPRPMFKTNVQEFVSIRKVIPQISIDVIRLLTTFFGHAEDHFQLNPSFEYTNSLSEKHEVIKPYACSENVTKFKNLQKLQSIGLVIPVDTPHMYFAAMESKTCCLTPLGKHYWHLVKDNRI